MRWSNEGACITCKPTVSNVVQTPTYLPAAPSSSPLVTSFMSVARNTTFACPVPTCCNVSKYWLSTSRSITSLDEAPDTLEVKSWIDSLSPIMIALRCLATPRPDRYIASASASARFTLSTFSPSARWAAASLRRLELLISFMAFITLWSGISSVTSACTMEMPYVLITSVSAFFSAMEISSLVSKASSRVSSHIADRITSQM
mmetsp:Transcript_15840/g.35061  ORF Transcript_15840/g.35061 Transcript_15840/m.35061 type:complete len:203 (+) Transcript_15840:693-1301(+)